MYTIKTYLNLLSDAYIFDVFFIYTICSKIYFKIFRLASSSHSDKQGIPKLKVYLWVAAMENSCGIL